MALLDGLQIEKPKANKWQLWGATLGDVGRTLQGQDPAYVNQLQNSLAEQQKEMEAKAQRQQMAAMADQLGLSPKEKFLLMANPQVYGQLLKEQLAPVTVSEGQTRLGPDGPTYTAPKTMTFGDNIYSVGPNGVADLFKRPQTYQEMQTQTRDTLNNQREIERLGISRGQLGVSQAGLALEREKHLARMRAGGYGTPGVGGVIGTTLDPNEWELQ